MPEIISPLDGDASVKQASGDVVMLFIWTQCTDPEGGPVTYDVEIASDAQYGTIVYSATQIGEPQAQVVVNVPSLPLIRFWHVRAVDAEGQDSDWSKTSTIRMVLNDGIDHGGGDCNISAGAAPGLALPALFGALALAFGVIRRKR